MTQAQVSVSPPGVPGAIDDPSRVAADELTFAGAGDTQVNGYLARPADGPSSRDPSGNDRDPRGRRAQRAHP